MRLVIALCLLPTLAAAEPTIETIDRGDVVEVIAHDLTAERTAIGAVRSRLEIPLAGKYASLHVPSPDATIVVTELSGRSDERVLSVKLAHDRAVVKAIAPLAKAIQVGPDLHILIPRKLPAAGAALVLPEPTPAKPEAQIAPPASPPIAPTATAPITTAPIATAAISPIATGPSASPTAAPPAAQEPAPATAPVAAPPQAAAPIASATAEPASPPLSRFSMIGALALAAIGAGMWIVRRRRGKGEPTQSIDVIAQRALGGKAKVVWLAAGTREMVIAVTPQSVRMLGQWKKGDQPTTQPAQVTLPTAQVVETTVANRGSSPAIAGILKLKQRAATLNNFAAPAAPPAPLDDDIATGDVEADALWAKEILLATRAHGYRGGR